MRRAPLIAAALAAGLTGCPIPQPLPDYPAGTVTPPRILMDAVDLVPSTDGNPIIFVPAGCQTTIPPYTLATSVSDPTTFEAIEARWFVNYDPQNQERRNPIQTDTIQPNADTTNLIRAVPPFPFNPYDFGPSPGASQLPPVPKPGSVNSNWWSQDGILRVVELVVSNGFDPALTADLPNKKPRPGFATQTYRWVFLSTTSVPCPP
jgi:hypothetical protein